MVYSFTYPLSVDSVFDSPVRHFTNILLLSNGYVHPTYPRLDISTFIIV